MPMSRFQALQFLQIAIFSVQLFCDEHSHIVPLINQQSDPASNSQAGHFVFRSSGQFFTSQQFFLSTPSLLLE